MNRKAHTRHGVGASAHRMPALLMALLIAPIGCVSLSYPELPETGPVEDAGGWPASAEDRLGDDAQPEAARAAASTERADSWSALSRGGREALRTGDLELARSRFEAALAASYAFPPHDARTRAAVGNLLILAGQQQLRGQFSVADELIQAALAEQQAGRVPGFGIAVPVLIRQAEHVAGDGDFPAALPYLEAADEIRPRPGLSDALMLELEDKLASTLSKSGRNAEAMPRMERLLEQLGSDPNTAPRTLANLHIAMAEANTAEGAIEAAEESYRQALAVAEVSRPDSPLSIDVQNRMAWFFVEQGRSRDALPLVGHAIETLDRLGVEGHARSAVLDTQATALARLGEFDAAAPIYREAIAGFGEETAHAEALAGIIDHYAEMLLDQGQTDEARLQRVLAAELRAGDSGSSP